MQTLTAPYTLLVPDYFVPTGHFTCLIELKSGESRLTLDTVPENMKKVELEPERHFQLVLQKKPK